LQGKQGIREREREREREKKRKEEENGCMGGGHERIQVCIYVWARMRTRILFTKGQKSVFAIDR
jgi:hypothetical protein